MPTNSLDDAFAALKQYRPGSSRASLLPIDQAVNESARGDLERRKSIEHQLLQALQTAQSAPAKQYLCGQLLRIGTAQAVPALEKLLADPVAGTCARSALQAIGGSVPAKALRRSIPKLQMPEKLGAINSLGELRDSGSRRFLLSLAKDSNRAVATAANHALQKLGPRNT